MITDLLAHFSTKCELIDYSVVCNDPAEGIKLLNNSLFDILFLDFNMPSLNGQDLLELKRDKSKVIMITSNTAFAVKSYQYDDVLDYLVKPIDYSSFYSAIDRIRTKIHRSGSNNLNSESKNTLMIKDGAKWIPMPFDSIFYIKSESNYSTFYTKTGKIMSLINLKSLNEKLPESFIRCHRSFIINTNYINYINQEGINIQKEFIPVSAAYKQNIKQYIDSLS